VLVRWVGSDASGDTWEQLDNLTYCDEAIAAFKQPEATGRSLPRPPPPPQAATTAAPPPPGSIPPAGFTVDAAPPGDLGASLVGRTLLYWWPDDGWQRGTRWRACFRVPVREAPSRMLWPTPGRRRRCAARRTRCSTPPPSAAPVGCWVVRGRSRSPEQPLPSPVLTDARAVSSTVLLAMPARGQSVSHGRGSPRPSNWAGPAVRDQKSVRVT
jgi:hypothetical protein